MREEGGRGGGATLPCHFRLQSGALGALLLLLLKLMGAATLPLPAGHGCRWGEGRPGTASVFFFSLKRYWQCMNTASVVHSVNRHFESFNIEI